jgi:hypothetical protein
MTLVWPSLRAAFRWRRLIEFSRIDTAGVA